MEIIMNNERRKAINEIIAKLDEVRSELDSCMYLEQEEYDNMPEGLQKSDRGVLMQMNSYILCKERDSIIEQIGRLTGIIRINNLRQ